MHEMALTEAVIRIVETEAGRQACRRVTVVRLEVGGLAPVEPEAITFCFAALARGTVAEGARLEIARPPGTAWCMECDCTVTIQHRFDPCALCGGHRLRLTSGEELRVTELEVD